MPRAERAAGAISALLQQKPARFSLQTGWYNFDSSDNSGGNVLAIPRVRVKIDGVTTDFFDTAQVLNTQGDDHLAAAGLNESH